MRLKPVIFFTVVGFLAALMISQEYQGPGPTLEGYPAPPFELADENGTVLSLEDYRGKLLFLNFWATWCLPCIDEMPDMMALQSQYEGRPFEMLAISVDVNWELVQNFYAEHGLDLPTRLDPGRQTYEDYKILGIPETFLIDGNGIIARKYIGSYPWTQPPYVSEIENLVRAEEQRMFGINSQAGD